MQISSEAAATALPALSARMKDIQPNAPASFINLPRKAMSAALDGVGQGVLVMDRRQRVVLINRSARQLLRLPVMEVEGRNLREVLARSPALDGQMADILAERCLATHLVEDDLMLPLGQDGGGATARMRSLADRHRALFLEPLIPVLRSEGDALTGLADRTGFLNKLRGALGRNMPDGLAVMAMDLGRFKAVNDTLGHALGDALLRDVAGRLRETLRRNDIAARLSGDEFAVMAELSHGGDDAQALAGRVVELLSRSYRIDGHVVHLDARAGLALAPDHGATAEVLLGRAMLALRQAKQDGADRRIFSSHMQEKAEARRTLEMDLRRALDLQQFELFYQPLVNLACGTLAGFEALIRWRHPTRGLVPPNDFIPLAEEIGLISDVGDWVVREACREAARWTSPVSVSVNAASAQFDSGQLIGAVRDALNRSGLPPTRLEVEVTETALLGRGDTTLETLQALRAMGVRIAMDDFGTGYSSLTQLQSYPFDKLKIDRSFVSRIGDAKDSTAIIRAIARMGSSLGLRTVAEGVETAEQLNTLRAEGCDEVQGYLLSRPVPTSEIDRLLARFPAAKGKPC